MKNTDVVIVREDCYEYPAKESLFRPSEKYPEAVIEDIAKKPNRVYKAVREGFYLMGLDKDNYGTENWNPLKNYVKPGNTVLIKPNLVRHCNPVGSVNCLYTHPSVVAAVIDYVLIALDGRGKIIVGDAPVQECDFEQLVADSGYSVLIEYLAKQFPDVKFSLIDFRDLKSTVVNGVLHQEDVGATTGVEVNLGSDSEFFGMTDREYSRLRITNYNPNEMTKYHNEKRNVYYINTNVLNADVIINMPKPKTHRKAGVTISLKNMVGINARKEYLPHHTVGSKKSQGDEYLNSSILKALNSKLTDSRNEAMSCGKYGLVRCYKFLGLALHCFSKIFARDTYTEGSWYGNNTISRTIVDLNKILFYADAEGNIKDTAQRKYLIVADMIVSGEKDGPLNPTDKNVGIIAMGDNPVGFDLVIAKLMGADTDKIPTLNLARKKEDGLKLFDGANPAIKSNDSMLNNCTLENISENSIIPFEPTSGWREAFPLSK